MAVSLNQPTAKKSPRIKIDYSNGRSHSIDTYHLFPKNLSGFQPLGTVLTYNGAFLTFNLS